MVVLELPVELTAELLSASTELIPRLSAELTPKLISELIVNLTVEPISEQNIELRL